MKLLFLLFLFIINTKTSFSEEDGFMEYGVEGLMRFCPPRDSGIPQILWDYYREKGSSWTLSSSLNISTECHNGFKSIWSGIEDGDEWAFKYLDTSGKLPPSFIEATHTAIGDFSECLQPSDIDVRPTSSQYCMIEIFPERPPNEIIGKLHIAQKRTCVNCPFFQGLCLPDSCSETDIRNLLNSALKEFGIKPSGYIYCDTSKTITYEHKFSIFSTHQWISLGFIATIFAIVLGSTALHVIQKMKGKDVENNLSTKLSLARNGWNLFHVKESQLADPRRNLMDTFKLVSVFSICISHGITCADVPIAYFMIDRLQYFQKFLKSPQTQGLYNDAGLSGICAFGGFAAFVVMYPMAKKKQLPYVLAFIDRFLKFLPSMICVTALDFVWPLLGTGPFHSHLSRFVVDRCQRGWWANLLMVNNLIEPEDTCAGHTFFASMTIQVVIFALIATKIFSLSDRKGIAFCSFLVLFSWIKMYYSVAMNDMTPTLMTPIPNIVKNRRYLIYIHEPWSTYLSPFFMGFLAGYWTLKGNKIQIRSKFQWLKWIIVTSIPFNIAHFIVMMCNSYEAVPPSLFPLAITANRNMIAIGSVLLLLIIHSDNTFSKYLDAEVNNNKKEDRVVFSLFTGLLRLSFSMFFINLYVARFEFFARKSLIANEVLTNIQRIISTTVIITSSAIAFHLIFVTPFDQLLKMVTRGTREKQTSKKSE